MSEMLRGRAGRARGRTWDTKARKQACGEVGARQTKDHASRLIAGHAPQEEVCRLTGKEAYAAGDLSLEIDSRVKEAAATFCGTDEYRAGDLTREVDRRAKASVAQFTGKEEYSFGDISLELERRRAEWVQGYIGKDYECILSRIRTRLLAPRPSRPRRPRASRTRARPRARPCARRARPGLATSRRRW
jgi:hypothetical protein